MAEQQGSTESFRDRLEEMSMEEIKNELRKRGLRPLGERTH